MSWAHGTEGEAGGASRSFPLSSFIFIASYSPRTSRYEILMINADSLDVNPVLLTPPGALAELGEECIKLVRT